MSANENKSFLKSDRVIDNRYNKDNIDNKGEVSSPSGEESVVPVEEELEEVPEYMLERMERSNYTYISENVIKVFSSNKYFRVKSGKAVSASA